MTISSKLTTQVIIKLMRGLMDLGDRARLPHSLIICHHYFRLTQKVSARLLHIIDDVILDTDGASLAEC